MKTLNLNEMKSKALSIELNDRVYSISFIPYVIEKDIYSNMTELNEKLSNLFSIDDMWMEKIKGWLEAIIFHPKNNNDVQPDFFDSLGVTEIIVITVSIVNFIAERISAMNEYFTTDEKKNVTIPAPEM